MSIQKVVKVRKGDMNLVMESVMLAELDDLDRFVEIIENLVSNGKTRFF